MRSKLRKAKKAALEIQSRSDRGSSSISMAKPLSVHTERIPGKEAAGGRAARSAHQFLATLSAVENLSDLFLKASQF